MQIITLFAKDFKLECNFWNENDIKKLEIANAFAYGVKNIFLSQEKIYGATRIEGNAYEICAKVVDLNKKTVQLVDLCLELDMAFPGDICVGDFVNFVAMRIDI